MPCRVAEAGEVACPTGPLASRRRSEWEQYMDSSAIPVFLAGPFPVIHSARIDRELAEVELDVALLIGGMPTMLAATSFPLDDTWERVELALQSGDARLGVAGMPHHAESSIGME